ncbi:hypothetical protein Lal_00002955 [Lupinus albus]|uniref:Putative oxidoreductase transcription regulator Homeodomain-LIKE family n=1 Tax=Lupinus albus TaxID=3870 RepID=A0A6A5N664_LUPAL|nr:putative oxidoreductase transcription regulator Homeodomain-LIKE family [Lupinus albus]KAF1882774.1 hypothetical protein Lal_00002955 [Lupinus albus]
MDGENMRIGAKKKKRSKAVEVGFDSDDNETIGSMFKLRRPKKKVNLVSEGSCGDRGKNGKAVVGKDSVADNMDLGGMDDTLASFRKRLKGPKRDRGSEASRGRSSASNVGLVSYSDRSLNVSVEGIEGHELSGDDFVAQESRGTSKDEKVVDLLLGDGTQHSSDEKMEDSLSVIIRKAQSNLIKKSRASSSSKKKKGTQNVDNDFRPGSESVLETVDYVGVCKSRSAPASESGKRDLTFSSVSDKQKYGDDCFQEDTAEGICDIPDESLADHSPSTNVCKGDRQQLSCVQSENVCLNPCSSRLDDVEIIRTLPLSRAGEGAHECTESEFKNRLNDELAQACNDASKHGVSASMEKESSLSSHDTGSLIKSSGSILIENNFTVSGNFFQESSDKEALKLSGFHVEEDGGVKSETEFISGRSFCDYSSSYTKAEVKDFDLGSSLEKNDVMAGGSLSPMMSNEAIESELANELNHPEKPSEMCNIPKDSTPSVLECLDPVQSDGSSLPSAIPDENENYAEFHASLSDFANNDGKISVLSRAVRKPKMHKHGDMTYEGDAEWEILINDQSLHESQVFADGDHTLRTRARLDSSFSAVYDSESVAVAAVSAGLKAHAASPIEKIKFKDILKRKGGLREYLDCRNKILSLWSRDVTRILPLAECGVSDTHSDDESPHSFLTREVYAFLDQCGYINVGIASQKEILGNSASDCCKLVEEKGLEESSTPLVADSEDGVSFIVGQTEMSDTSMEINKSLTTVYYEDLKTEAAEDRRHVNAATMAISNMRQHEERKNYEYRENGQSNESACVKSAVGDQIGDPLQSDSKARKRVIIIGAGPAGLTAARHLKRQGFSVIVLEARSRIGGRVFTDRSSLSVPVDLGASIITGVEADVATERRPDPSSLVCAQLGLELTVLNSDCPLYDTVTGQKVLADMDEALEAEYNSLLDDMELLVAQKGEQAMGMSLEDGLEYALKIRRMALSGSIGETEKHNSGYSPFDSKRDCTVKKNIDEEILSPLERRVMDWHFAHLEYGCAALLTEVSLPYWNQDDVYGGFGGAHCMIKGGYSTVVESLGEGLAVHLNHVVTNVSYGINESYQNNKVKVSTSNGNEFFGDAVLITLPLGCLKAETIQFSPPLPPWKYSSIQRLGFGVLNKVILEFPCVFWDDAVDYFGATSEERGKRGHCFMFWNVRKTVGAPVLIALVVGKAAIDGQSLSSSDHVNHALKVLRKLFGEASVPDPVGHVVTDWGRDPFSYGAYSYVAIGASGEDYDILGRPVDNCMFFAGEATCKEHPDTVGGAMMSGLREAVRIIDILSTGNDYTAEVEAMEVASRQLDTENEVRDITKRLNAVELSNLFYKNSLDGAQILTREALLREMFLNAKTNAGRLHVAKELLCLPVGNLKSFAGSKEGLAVLNSWILDSMGKDGTQLLRHCVRLLVRVSTDLLAVRLSGIGKTVKEKVCVHASRDIRAIASQLVNVWLEVFRKGKKAFNGGLKLSRQAIALDISKRKHLKDSASGKPPLSTHPGSLDNRGRQQSAIDSRHEVSSSRSQGSISKVLTEKEDNCYVISEEEQAAIAAAEAARAKAHAAAEAYAAAEARRNKLLQLPKIPSFQKFASKNDECDNRKKWSGALGRQDCISEIDSRNCRVRDWSVDFSAACVNLDNSRMPLDNLSQRSHSNEIASHLNFRENSGESVAVDSSIYTKAWIDTAGGVGIKDSDAIDRWQSQAAAADSYFSNPSISLKDEEDSNGCSRLPSWKHDGMANESSISQVTVNKETLKSHHSRGADLIKQAVVDYVGSLLMPLYKARKLDKDGYKAIMKKSATKVMEKATDKEKAMTVDEFLDFKRKTKIRSFVDTLIERHMPIKPDMKS